MVMGSITFLNPNDPEQPAAGVYGWFLLGEARAIYIGRAGGRRNPLSRSSTLLRGLQELSRSTFSSDPARALLDTDFIVGTALLYWTGRGKDCAWRHLSAEPGAERALWQEHKPLLQPSSTSISREFRIRKPAGGRWEREDVPHAQQILLAVFDAAFGRQV